MVSSLIFIIVSELIAILSGLSGQHYYPKDKNLSGSLCIVACAFTFLSWILYIPLVKNKIPDSTIKMGRSHSMAVVSSILSSIASIIIFSSSNGTKNLSRNTIAPTIRTVESTLPSRTVTPSIQLRNNASRSTNDRNIITESFIILPPPYRNKPPPYDLPELPPSYY